MQDDVTKTRKTLTLGWHPAEGFRPATPAADEYMEIIETPPIVSPALVANKVQPDRRSETAIQFERRMENWRDTVLGLRGGHEGTYCATWARLYVAARLKREREICEAANIPILKGLRTSIDVDELDGWLVEAAVRSLVDFHEKEALRLRYVWRYSDHWIKSKLMLRNAGLQLVLGRARKNLQQILALLEKPTKILPNNLHAGDDPRPESNDAP